MCLAIPAKIIELDGENATVDIEGVRRRAIVSLVDAPAVGDYILLHAGFAIRKWSEEDFKDYHEIVKAASPRHGRMRGGEGSGLFAAEA